MSPPRRRGRVWTRSEQGTAVYIEETDSLHLLNPTALAIWELCDGATTTAEMAEAIAELTGLDPEQANREVSQALEELRRQGLLG